MQRIQRYATRPKLIELFTEEKLKDKPLKDETICTAYVHYGYVVNWVYSFGII